MEEIVKLADQDEIFDLCDKRHAQKKKSQRSRLRKLLQMAGYGVDALTREHMIVLNEENFAHVMEEQLRNVYVYSPNPQFKKLPLMNAFDEELTLSPSMWERLEYLKLANPFPVQRVLTRYIMQTNCDLIVQAQAGSGKTFAYLLPIVGQLLEIKRDIHYPNTKSPYAVIIVPTIELAMQVAKDATRLIHRCTDNINVTFVVGGQDRREFNKSRAKGIDILIVTPGSLWNLFFDTKNGYGSALLSTDNIRFVVLDEADLLADERTNNKQQPDGPGSFSEIMKQFIVTHLTETMKKSDFRVFLFGATNMNQKFMYDLVTSNNYLEIQVGSNRPVSTVIQNFMKIKAEHNKLEQFNNLINYHADEYEKERPRNDGMGRRLPKTLVFVNHKSTSDRLAHCLISQGFTARSVNSDRSPSQRYEIVRQFLDGEIDILVASDVLARGMNFRVEIVINYDFPWKFDEYSHRISRVGRIGNIGKAITFFNPREDCWAAPALVEGCHGNGQSVPEFLRDAAEYEYQNNNYYNKENNDQRRPFNNHKNGRRPSLESDYSYISSNSGNSSRYPSPKEYY